uniref:uncharacterized protein LOC120336303 n=1 Tax=Styela clava TaxID=7725 RepID=UPI001939A808|nr:uncharacterized protein LOC120336303 [Styela clava]
MGLNSNRLPRRERQNVHADYASRMSKPVSGQAENSLHKSKSTTHLKGGNTDSESNQKRHRTLRDFFNFRRSRKQTYHERQLTTVNKDNADPSPDNSNNCTTTAINSTKDFSENPEIVEQPQAANSSHVDKLECESRNPMVSTALYNRRFNHFEMAKRHSLAANFLSKNLSWNSTDDQEYFTSMVSLPGQDKTLAEKYNHVATQNNNNNESILHLKFNEKTEQTSVIGTPVVSRRYDRLSLNLNNKKTDINKLKRNASDVSPYLQRHGIHGLPGPEEEEMNFKGRTGLSRSQSMFRPTKPTTPKPLKDAASLSDSQFRLFCQPVIRRTSIEHGRPGVTVSESMCDLRPPKVVTWKRHSVAPVNEDIYEGLISSEFTKSLGMLKSHAKKGSGPMSELDHARTASDRPVQLFNKRKNSRRNSNLSLANISTSSKNLIEDELLLKSNNILENSTFTKMYENSEHDLGNEAPRPFNVRSDQMRPRDHQTQPNFRHRVMSASYCYDESVENYIVGNGINHASDSLESLDFSTSLSIPTDLDRMHWENKRLEMSRNAGALWENDYSTSYHIMDIADIFERERDEKILANLSGSVVSSYAEALWDHVTMDEEELSFRVGDVILVKSMEDPVWWWGELDDAEGWLPASFVRVIVNQSWPLSMDDQEIERPNIRDSATCSVDTIDGQTTNMKTIPDIQTKTAGSVNLTTLNKMRSNVVKEILNSERDFLKHLRDIVEGYLERCRKRMDMFSSDFILTVFSNIEDIYKFQGQFFKQLQKSFQSESPHESDIGSVFLQYKKQFEIYSEYCNNHPSATSKLAEAMQSKKCRYFFEACRLLQQMIDISIDGYLLTPVQKICKYPLQLAELLKYTNSDDPNYKNVEKALEAMQDVARMINERKRQVENIEKITSWQKNIIDWQDADVLDRSTELIYSNELYVLTLHKAKPQLRVGFLFDGQFVICKKDLLRKDLLYYKTRLDLSKFAIVDSDEVSNDDLAIQLVSGTNLKHWWQMKSTDSSEQIICLCKKEEGKKRWIKEFNKERTMSEIINEHRYVVSKEIKRKIVENATLRCQKQGNETLRKQTYTKRWKRSWTKHYLDRNRNFNTILSGFS